MKEAKGKHKEQIAETARHRLSSLGDSASKSEASQKSVFKSSKSPGLETNKQTNKEPNKYRNLLSEILAC